MFINSVPKIVGYFFKHWILDDWEGLRLLCAETYYRPDMEVIAKLVAYTQVFYNGWWCYNCWEEHTRWVDIKYAGDRWYEMIIFPFILMIVSLIIGFLIVRSYPLTTQGFEIDPDEDKERVLMNQIEKSVKEWFAYHKYDNIKKAEISDTVSSNGTNVRRKLTKMSFFTDLSKQKKF